jgi:diguanylate cyclase (GGDEF)-like protein
LWQQPPAAVTWLVGVDLAVLTWAVSGAVAEKISGWVLLRFGVLVVSALLHVVGTRESEERRRHAHRRTEHVDQTSIWIFTAALALPVSLVLAVVLVVRAQRYLIARKQWHTFVFTTGAIVASALSAHEVAALTPLRSWLSGGGLPPHHSVTITAMALIGLAGSVSVYFLVQSILVGVARGLITNSWSPAGLLGDSSANLFILTTLALAVLTVLAQAIVPPLALIMVPIAVRATHMEQQLSQARAEREQLRADALHDPKTGLLNDRGFSPAAITQMYGDRLRGRYSALLFADIDKFKDWNTKLGHIGGDQVLGALAQVLRSTVREGDLTCRWGGEEFLVLLSDTDPAMAVQIAERIRINFATMPLTVKRPAGGQDMVLNPNERDGEGFTISIGIAVSPTHSTDLDELKEIANQALRSAKHNGRNQVVVAPAPAVRIGTPGQRPEQHCGSGE